MERGYFEDTACIALVFAICMLLVCGFVAIGAGRAAADPGDVTLVSTDSAGTPGDYGSDSPSMTPDGRYVAFESVATNLVTPSPPATISEIYRKDLVTGNTILVSSSASEQAGDDNSYDAQISSDGRYVCFYSYAQNLVSPAPAPGNRQVYRKDLQTGAVVLVSCSDSDEAGNGWSHFPSISSDGHLVAFMSSATNLVSPAPPPGNPQIYRKNVDTGAIILASTNSSEVVGNGGSTFPSISSSGRYVAFGSDSSNLVTPPPPADISQVYRKDLQTNEVRLASVRASGQIGDANSYNAVINSDGNYIAFNSDATNLISPSPPPGVREVYRKDLDGGGIDIISAGASGQPADDGCDLPALSSDGRYAAFQSFASNLVSPAPPAGFSQAYRKDLETGDILLVSADPSGTAGDDNSGGCSASSDGRYIAFDSGASNLVSPAPPAPEVYRKELPTPSMDIIKDGPQTSFIGDEITYRLTVSNSGNVALSDVVVRDPLFGTGWSRTIGNLSIGETVRFEHAYKVKEADAGSLINTATATGEYAGKQVSASGSHTVMVKSLGSMAWIVAEGSTGEGFDTFILIQNPNDVPATTAIAFATEEGIQDGTDLTIPPKSRVSMRLSGYMPNEWSVSTLVAAEVPVVVERSMYWNSKETDDPYEMMSGHANLGLPAPMRSDFKMDAVAERSTSRYFPEGSTAGFDTWILLFNPMETQAQATVTLMDATGPVVEEDVTIEPLSRKTVHLNKLLPDAFEVATRVESDTFLVAERSMYWDPAASAKQPYEMIGGHATVGSPQAANDWYIAEGSTGGGFETYILLQNPGDTEAQVTLTFMDNTGIANQATTNMPAQSRSTLKVSDYVPDNLQVSTSVTSNVPVVAERSMYWDKREASEPSSMKDGHSCLGEVGTAKAWMVPEGSTGGGFDTFILITNMEDTEATATVTFMTEEGPQIPIYIPIPANSRYTLWVNECLPDTFQVSTLVTGDKALVVERSMYWDNREMSPQGNLPARPFECIGGHSANGFDP